MTIVIVGSGPAGAFAALGALEQGGKVLMIDSGLQPEPEAVALKKRLGSLDWKYWTNEDYAKLKASGSKIDAKLIFGSDFATRQTSKNNIRQKNCKIVSSEALGGLSNIWGRGIEPPYGNECKHWEFYGDFIKSLKIVLSHIPFSGEIDNLSNVMPLYTNDYEPHKISSESQELLNTWNTNADKLNNSGIYFGKTRLALRPAKQEKNGCKLCSMCFYGCAYNAMFDSGEIISYLKETYTNFEYRSGLIVEKFLSEDNKIEIIIRNISSNAIESIYADKLILAAGAAQTTIIAMRSLNAKQATIKNSDLIKIPFLKIFGNKKTTSEDYHSLSQLTLTLDNRKISNKAIVIHLFGKNPLIKDAVLSLFPNKIKSFTERLLSQFFRRFYIGMCFLSSDDSADIKVKNNGINFEFIGQKRFTIYLFYFQLLLNLLKNIRKTGLLPIPFVGGVAMPGSSVHIGGSLSQNSELPVRTNIKGALISVPNVYVADAASLPDIPAGSYTLSIMANAHRIGICSAST